MSEHTIRHDTSNWESLPPNEVLAALVYELYNPVSLLGSHLNRLVSENDPLTEEDYDTIFEQMQTAVHRLSKTVVSLRRYVQDSESGNK